MKKFEIEMLPPLPGEERVNSHEKITSFINNNTIRLCIDISEELSEMLLRHSYWARKTKGELAYYIIEKYLMENSVEPLPDNIKRKNKPGPKRKNKSQ